jgi:transcriptional regulator with XRE-family HTH domain
MLILRLRLKEVAEEKQVSMTKLFHRSQVGYTSIRAMFKDPYYSTTTETINRLAKALNVPTTALLEDVSEEQAAAEQEAIAQRKSSSDQKHS